MMIDKKKKKKKSISNSIMSKEELPLPLYPVTALADQSAAPFTPFARSVPAPEDSRSYESQERRVEALKATSKNPDAPSMGGGKHIKNKQMRQEFLAKQRHEKAKAKRKVKDKKKREREQMEREEEQGDKDVVVGDSSAPKRQRRVLPKGVPKTVENMRVYDEQLVRGDDQEVLREMATDEFSSFFDRGDAKPKVMLTSSIRPCATTKRFMSELTHVIPGARWFHRRTFDIKMIVKGAIDRRYTDILLVNEDQKAMNMLVHIHLPCGPSAYYALSSVTFERQLRGRGRATKHAPELILNNFNTRLAHTVGRMLSSLFPKAPEFHGRRVVTFHCQRDFVFFRHHRYIFDDDKTARLQECGPRFTLKLRRIQRGLFDPQNAEWIWIWKPKEQGKKKGDLVM
jgi:ribosome production factor 1